MAEKLSDYLVLEILTSGNYGETCYMVKHKRTESLLTWKAYDCEEFDEKQLKDITEDVTTIGSLKNINIIKYYETILHSASNTLYVVIDYCPDNTLFHLIEKSKLESLSFTENFIWNVLHQLALVCKLLLNIKVNALKKQLKTCALFVDSDAKLKVDVFYLMVDQNNPEYKRSCPNLICRIGSIIYEMCTLTKHSNDVDNSTIHHNINLQNIVNLLLSSGTHYRKCTLKPEIILRHPTVLLNIKPDSKDIFCDPQCLASPTISNDSAFESDESLPKINADLRKSISNDNIPRFIDFNYAGANDDFHEVKNLSNKQNASIDLSPTLAALDLKIPGYVPPKSSLNVSKWTSRLELCKDPKEVSENALSQVWLERLAALREREEAILLKEQEINKKQRFHEVASKINAELNRDNETQLEIKSIQNMQPLAAMPGITLQTAMNKKVLPQMNLEDTRIAKFKGRPSLSDGSVVSNTDKRDSYTRKTYRRSSSVRTRYRKKQQFSFLDLDSSLSADQGDTSILPTSTKLSSELVPRPTSMHNLAPRKVHFNARNNPFTDYESVSSTTLTFFEIENVNSEYEVPKAAPPQPESIADRIAKFTYLDLEAMTNEKRALMEEWRKTPPKINRETKPTLRSKLKAAENFKKSEINIKNSTARYVNGNLMKHPPVSSRLSFCSSHSAGSTKSAPGFLMNPRKDNRRKSMSSTAPEEMTKKILKSSNKENFDTPAPDAKKKDSKRKSILGFKTPFTFRL